MIRRFFRSGFDLHQLCSLMVTTVRAPNAARLAKSGTPIAAFPEMKVRHEQARPTPVCRSNCQPVKRFANTDYCKGKGFADRFPCRGWWDSNPYLANQLQPFIDRRRTNPVKVQRRARSGPGDAASGCVFSEPQFKAAEWGFCPKGRRSMKRACRAPLALPGITRT
jgi:hypothetical protein